MEEKMKILIGNGEDNTIETLALSLIRDAVSDPDKSVIVCLTDKSILRKNIIMKIIAICNELDIKVSFKGNVYINDIKIIIKNFSSIDQLRGIKIKHMKLYNLTLKSEIEAAWMLFKQSSCIYPNNETSFTIVRNIPAKL